MKLRTDAQIWLYLAEAFARSEDERGYYDNELTSCGICKAVAILCRDDMITDHQYFELNYAVSEDVGNVKGRYSYYFFCVPSKRNRILRADYCYLLYCQAGGK